MVSILIDDDLMLRSFQPGDEQELFAVVDASRSYLRQWLPWVDATQSPEHSLQFIHQTVIDQNNQSGLTMGIFYQNRIIGSMGMHQRDHNLNKAQLGYWIAQDYEGKGIINKCLQGFIGFLFGKVGLNKLEIQFVVNNQRSAKVAERLGFKLEGVLRDSHLMNGSYKDIAVTGLLKSEWKQQPGQANKPFVPN